MHVWARQRFAAARVARLATTTPQAQPHLVPIVFAVVGDRVWTVVDAKPKRTRSLQRLVNIEADPRVSLLADHYDEDWSRLWWVRADGHARILPVEDTDGASALTALASKYAQYLDQPPPGPLICVEVARWTSWSASAG